MEGSQVKHRPPGEDYWQNIDGTLSCRSTIIAALTPGGGKVEREDGQRLFDMQGRLFGVILNDGTILRTKSDNSKDDHSHPTSQDKASAKAGEAKKGKAFGEIIVKSKIINIRNFTVCLIKFFLHIDPIPKNQKDVKCFFEDFKIIK